MRMIRVLSANPDEVFFVNPLHIVGVQADGKSSIIYAIDMEIKDTRSVQTLVDILNQLELKLTNID